MRISVAEAADRLTELTRRADEGEQIVLTDNGRPAFQLVPIARRPLPPEERKKVFDEIRSKTPTWSSPFDTDAARSQDFLYDELGLPK
jgi:prevent-host-death family protein